MPVNAKKLLWLLEPPVLLFVYLLVIIIGINARGAGATFEQYNIPLLAVICGLMILGDFVEKEYQPFRSNYRRLVWRFWWMVGLVVLTAISFSIYIFEHSRAIADLSLFGMVKGMGFLAFLVPVCTYGLGKKYHEIKAGRTKSKACE